MILFIVFGLSIVFKSQVNSCIIRNFLIRVSELFLCSLACTAKYDAIGAESLVCCSSMSYFLNHFL